MNTRTLRIYAPFIAIAVLAACSASLRPAQPSCDGGVVDGSLLVVTPELLRGVRGTVDILIFRNRPPRPEFTMSVWAAFPAVDITSPECYPTLRHSAECYRVIVGGCAGRRVSITLSTAAGSWPLTEARAERPPLAPISYFYAADGYRPSLPVVFREGERVHIAVRGDNGPNLDHDVVIPRAVTDVQFEGDRRGMRNDGYFVFDVARRDGVVSWLGGCGEAVVIGETYFSTPDGSIHEEFCAFRAANGSAVLRSAELRAGLGAGLFLAAHVWTRHVEIVAAGSDRIRVSASVASQVVDYYVDVRY